MLDYQQSKRTACKIITHMIFLGPRFQEPKCTPSADDARCGQRRHHGDREKRGSEASRRLVAADSTTAKRRELIALCVSNLLSRDPSQQNFQIAEMAAMAMAMAATTTPLVAQMGVQSDRASSAVGASMVHLRWTAAGSKPMRWTGRVSKSRSVRVIAAGGEVGYVFSSSETR